MGVAQSIAKKVAAAAVSGGGINIRHGKYVLMIKRILAEKKFSGECFIMELVVVESEKIEVVEGDAVKDVEPNKVGSDCSYVVNFDGKGKQSAGGNVKQVVCALFNVSPDQLKEEEFEKTVEEMCLQHTDPEHPENEPNPMRGYLIRCSTYPKEVRSQPGKWITGLRWENLAPPGEGENSIDKIVERRAVLAAVEKKA